MRVYVTYHVHPKRVDQLIELARGLGASVAFEQAPDIEVLSEKPDEKDAKTATVSGGEGRTDTVPTNAKGKRGATNAPQNTVPAEVADSKSESEVIREQV